MSRRRDRRSRLRLRASRVLLRADAATVTRRRVDGVEPPRPWLLPRRWRLLVCMPLSLIASRTRVSAVRVKSTSTALQALRPDASPRPRRRHLAAMALQMGGGGAMPLQTTGAMPMQMMPQQAMPNFAPPQGAAASGVERQLRGGCRGGTWRCHRGCEWRPGRGHSRGGRRRERRKKTI